MFIFQIILIAISLSMDAVSLAISISTNYKLTRITSLKYSVYVGLFHFFMPLIGYYLRSISRHIINIPSKELFIGVIIFLIIEILISKNDNKKNTLITPLLFAFTVSIDSFSIGISIEKHLLLSCLIFMLISGISTFISFNIGNKISDNFESKSKVISVSILLLLLIKSLCDM